MGASSVFRREQRQSLNLIIPGGRKVNSTQARELRGGECRC